MICIEPIEDCCILLLTVMLQQIRASVCEVMIPSFFVASKNHAMNSGQIYWFIIMFPVEIAVLGVFSIFEHTQV
jgi:hypothetical protein